MQAAADRAKRQDAALVALKPHDYLTEKDLAKSVPIMLQETQTDFILEIQSECYLTHCLLHCALKECAHHAARDTDRLHSRDSECVLFHNPYTLIKMSAL